MTKQQYLDDNIVIGFRQYLTNVVTAEVPLKHDYEVVSKKWKSWCIEHRHSNYKYKFFHLQDAFKSYWWPAKQVHNGMIQENYGYNWNDTALTQLQIDLHAAVNPTASSNDLVAACACVLVWGGVEIALGWCIDQDALGRLRDVIVDATTILDGNDDVDVERRFDGTDLHLNAGLTKIYSLNSRQSIIYDGRVGAALCLLVRKYLQSINHCGPVPSLLNFRWGQGSGRGNRDPSVPPHRFRQLNSTKPHDWAKCNLWANWLLQEVVSQQGVQKTLVSEWEL